MSRKPAFSERVIQFTRRALGDFSVVIKSLVTVFAGILFITPLASYAEQLTLVELSGFPPVSRGNFQFMPVRINSDAVAMSIFEEGGSFLLPGFESDKSLTARVVHLDSNTARKSGDIVFSGSVYSGSSSEIVGEFVFSHFEGSEPYIAVATSEYGYEVFWHGTAETGDFVLKKSVEKIFEGPLDISDYVLLELVKHEHRFKPTDNPKQGLRAKSGSGCDVQLGVGYTIAAHARNSSIVSAIGAWVSDLNDMLDDIGVPCDFALVGTKKFLTYSEGTTSVSGLEVITTDWCRVAGCGHPYNITQNSEVVWYRDANSMDAVIMIQSADINGGPSDNFQGVVWARLPGRPSSNRACVANNFGNAPFGCSDFAIVRDDYAFGFRVFAHEALHMVGARHEYAYGGPGSIASGGSGFTSMMNYTDVLPSGSNPISTTIMSNTSNFCSWSSRSVDLTCGMRLPFIASKTTPQSVTPAFTWPQVPTNRYFPSIYPLRTQVPYSSSSDDTMADIIEKSMGYVSGLR
ncbi:MAG: hypothetical protein V2I45_11505 [Halieaceae bacterium]|jgi:hypothetical protein|nr:hypothetical protein [Halieaceae bacterium]